MPGPLDGIRILDFTIAQQGPGATLLLADMGAEVIKVEEPGVGEIGRLIAPDRKRGVSPYFIALNRGKKGITLDLKSSRGRDVALRIGRECDVVVNNFRPGVMERRGLTYEAFATENPRVIYASASAFGTKGPMGDLPGNDILAQAYSGFMSVTGEGETPLPGGTAIADHVGALTLAVGIVSALFARERSGRGQRVESSLLGGMIAAQCWELLCYTMSGELRGKAGRGNAHLPHLWYTYRTADGWLAIGGLHPVRWTAFCHAIDRPELEMDDRFNSVGKRVRHKGELNDLLDAHFSTLATEVWLRKLRAADVFCAPVQDYSGVVRSEQVRANAYMTSLPHARLGELDFAGFPVAFSATPAEMNADEPLLGEHTEEILKSFGYDEGEIEGLRRAAVI